MTGNGEEPWVQFQKEVRHFESMFDYIESITTAFRRFGEYKKDGESVDILLKEYAGISSDLGWLVRCFGRFLAEKTPHQGNWEKKCGEVVQHREKRGSLAALLVWRVKPELDYTDDFETAVRKYRIYTRFGTEMGEWRSEDREGGET